MTWSPTCSFRPSVTYITGGDCIGSLTFFQKVSSQLSWPPVKISRPPSISQFLFLTKRFHWSFSYPWVGRIENWKPINFSNFFNHHLDVNNIASPWKMMKHAILNLFSGCQIFQILNWYPLWSDEVVRALFGTSKLPRKQLPRQLPLSQAGKNTWFQVQMLTDGWYGGDLIYFYDGIYLWDDDDHADGWMINYELVVVIYLWEVNVMMASFQF